MFREHEDKLLAILEKTGTKEMLTVCIEEMSELTKELCKWERYHDVQTLMDIQQEMADVYICLEHLKNIVASEHQMVYSAEFNIVKDGIDERIKRIADYKIDRVLKRLEEEDGLENSNE